MKLRVLVGAGYDQSQYEEAHVNDDKRPSLVKNDLGTAEVSC
jgi:hypothetical protein